MRGERRVITMLFCDVTGSTSMAEQLDAEEWAEIMNEAFEFLIAPVYRYEGTLARMMGDGILAFFGAPIAHEDDPQRAVLAGLDIVRGLEPFKQEIAEEYGLDFDVRVGINTGPVVVGDIGSDLALEYTAMGDAINLAARMEQTAKPGTVQISSNTYHLVAPLFDLEPLGAIEVKGKDDPVESYRVVRQKKSPGRLRGIEGLETPLVGRENEINALRSMLKDLDQGKGGIVFLVGDAGLGKSRLINELRLELESSNGSGSRWYESNGVPYESTRPYSMFQRRMRKTLGLDAADSPDTIRQKIRLAAQRYPDEEQKLVIQTIEAVLALSEEETSSSSGAEARKQQLFNVVLDIWRADAQRERVVAVFDDMHWADGASVELMVHLFQLAKTTPILFICATRPEYDTPAWKVKEGVSLEYESQYLEITLTPLSDGESHSLVNNLLTVADLPDELRNTIAVKTDGNPFFVEEVVRSLIDAGTLVRSKDGEHWKTAGPVEEFTIPDNVQSLLISRIDRLENQSKRTLQLASVIGRSFYEKILAQIADRIEDLPGELESLEMVELIAKSAHIPELEYMFRHELTRDAAYHTILRRERRRYHRRVGEALETIMPDRIGEEAHRLAYHFDEARDNERALKYYIMAGDGASRIYANSEALAYYGRSLEFAHKAGTNDQLIHLHKSRGRVFEVRGQYDEAIENYLVLQDLGEEREASTMVLAALMARATVHSTYTSRFDPQLGESLAKEALNLADKMDDRPAQATIYWILMLVNTFGLHHAGNATEYGEKSLAIARENKLREQLAFTLHDLARPYFYSERMKDAFTVLEEAGDIFKEVGNLPMLADNRATLAYGYRFIGSLGEAAELSMEALRVSRSTGNRWGESYSLVILGSIRFAEGRIDEALKAFEESLSAARDGNFSGPSTYASIQIASVYGYIGDYGSGIEMIHTGIRKADKSGQVRGRADLLIGLSRLLIESGEIARARAYLEEVEPFMDTISADPSTRTTFIVTRGLLDIEEGAYEQAISEIEPFIESSRSAGLLSFLPASLLIAGQAYNKIGQVEKAIARLLDGYAIAKETGIVKSRLPIALELAEIYEGLGKNDRAISMRAEARESAAFFAGNIGDPEMRDRFMNRYAFRE
jgi:class 3 adenylate cyclase/tetratricopeptide (TPR) repeat protein